YVVQGLDGYIDIFTDEEAWELKSAPASGLDVYQLFAYLDMGKIKNGYLVAPSFKTGAKAAKDFINKKHDKEIKLVPIKEFPIDRPPTEIELQGHY
ncbi:unnamed protein product, partial [marine sediment metagenome]